MFILGLFYVVFVLALLDFILFAVMIIIRLSYKIRTRINSNYRQRYETQILSFVSGGNNLSFLRYLTRFHKKMIEGICLEYLPVVKGDIRYNILKIIKMLNVQKYYLADLESGSWWRKARGAYYLGIYENFDAIPLLTKNLYSDNIDVFYNCAKALIRICNKIHLKDICCAYAGLKIEHFDFVLDIISDIEEDIYEDLSSIIKDGDVRVKVFSLYCLGVKKHEGALNFIREFIASGDLNLITAALRCSIMIGSVHASSNLYIYLSCLKYNDNIEISKYLAELLGYFKDPESVSALSILLNHANMDVSMQAAYSLISLGREGAFALASVKFGMDENKRSVVSHVFESTKVRKNYQIGEPT